MATTIRKNEKLQGLEILFDKKPSEAVLSYLKELHFRWNGREKVWYKAYSESLEKQIREYFKDADVQKSDPVPAGEKNQGIVRKIDLSAYHKQRRGPRKDVIIAEIIAGKMEYAVKKSFDGMTDSYNYFTVTNDSFSPAEEAIRKYNSGEEVNFLVEDLKHAIGQSHYIYSANAAHNDELGYFISFSDYYIRYKNERPKSIPKVISEEEEAEMRDKEEKAIFGYHFNFEKPNKDAEDLVNQLSLRYNFEALPFQENQSTNVLMFNFKGAKYYLLDNSGEFKMDNVTGETYMVGQTEFKHDDGKLKTINELAGDIYEMVKDDLDKETEINDDYSKYYRVLDNDIIVFKNKEAAESVLSKAPVLKIAYSVTFIHEPSTPVQLGERLPSGFYATKPRDGQGNKLPFKALTKSTLDYYFKPELDAYFNDKPAESEVDQYEVGDRVKVTMDYMGAAAGSVGEITEFKIFDGARVAKVYLGSNLSGQKIYKNLPFDYIKKAPKKGQCFKSPKVHLYIYDIEDKESYKMIQIETFSENMARFGLVSKHGFDPYKDKLEEVPILDLKKFISSKKWYINNCFIPMYGQSDITENQKRKLFDTLGDQILLWIYAEIQSREVEDRALAKPEKIEAESSNVLYSFDYESSYGKKIIVSLLDEPGKDSITNEKRPYTIMNGENPYSYEDNVEEAMNQMEYLKAKYQDNDPNAMIYVARNYGRQYVGFTESTAKAERSKIDNVNYTWQLMPWPGMNGRFYLKGIRKLTTKFEPKPKSVHESAEIKAIGLITGNLVDRIKGRGYDFEYGKMDESTYYEVVGIVTGSKADKLRDAGITVTRPVAEKPSDKPDVDAIKIAKAKAEALIMILKLKNKNKEIDNSIKPKQQGPEPEPTANVDDFDFAKEYDVYADGLAERYNYLVSQSETKWYDLNKVYTELTGKEILPENYNKFAISFLNEIAHARIKLKKPIDLEEGTIQLFSLPVNKMNKTGLESLKYITLAKTDRSVSSYPGLIGVFVDNGKLVASDLHRLVIIADDSQSKNEGKVVDPVTGQEIEAKYPNYKALIPTNDERTGIIRIDKLIELAKSASISFHNIEDPIPVMPILFPNGMKTGFDPDLMVDVLQILKSNGADSVKIEYASHERPLMFRADNDNMALLMPKVINGDGGLRTETVILDLLTEKAKLETVEKKPEPTPMTFDEFKANRPNEVIAEYVGGKNNDFVKYKYRRNKYSDRFGWFNQSLKRQISEKEAYEQHLYNLKNSRTGSSFADSVLKAAESVGGTVTMAEGGVIPGQRTLFDQPEQFGEGGTIPVSQEFRPYFAKLKAANRKNIRLFAQSLGIINPTTEPIVMYLQKHNVPLIMLDHNSINKFSMFKLHPPPESAIFFAQYWKPREDVKPLINIYLSVLPKSMIGLGKWAISLDMSFKEALESTFIHECIHAYLFKEGFIEVSTFHKRLDLLRFEVLDYVNANPDQFNKAQKSAISIIADEESNVSETITYSFTWSKVADVFRKAIVKTGKTAWQDLLDIVNQGDRNGILILYASKHSDVPPLALAIAQAKYKLYQSGQSTSIQLGEGGLIDGPSHEEGGVHFVVSSTGQDVELEGKEAIIKKKVVLSSRKYNFEGKKQTPKEILNKLNTDGGGNPIL